MKTRKPDTRKAKVNEDKSQLVLNQGNKFSDLATRIRQQADAERDGKAPQSDADLESKAVPATPKAATTPKAKAATPPTKKESKKKTEKQIPKTSNELVIPYEAAGAINMLINSYVDYLEQLQQFKNPNQRSFGVIQQKINNAKGLTINKAEQLDFDKFTDAAGFSATAKLIKEHRDKSFFNKYRQSQGALLIDGIENLLPESYAKELKVRRLRYSLEKYQAHLNDAFFKSEALNEKKQVVASMLQILAPKSDTDLDEMLELFAAGWQASLSVVVKHRNTFFEAAHAQSEGEKLKLNIENILKTGKDLPESSYSIHM